MEYIIAILLIILIILVIICLIKLFKVNNNHEIISKLDDKQDNMISSIEQKLSLNNQEVDTKLNLYNQKSNQEMQHLIANLERKIQHQELVRTQESQHLLTQVNKLDIAQQQLMGLGESITSLEKTLNDKKSRGTFGEIRLEVILRDVLGENNKQVWDRQVSMTNGTIVDFLLHAPQPLGNIAIDSKFPLEGYQRILQASSEEELTKARKEFEQHVIKHIKDISSKYIIKGETASQAIMFIPSETIFSEIYAHHEKIITQSYIDHVWIVSPTTLMAILNLLLVVSQEVKRSEQAKTILMHLDNLQTEFKRFDERFNRFNKDIEKITTDAKDISITANKINKQFDKIAKVDFDEE